MKVVKRILGIGILAGLFATMTAVGVAMLGYIPATGEFNLTHGLIGVTIVYGATAIIVGAIGLALWLISSE